MALLQAVKKGDRDLVKQLLTQGYDPNVEDEQGNSALIYAAQK